MLSDEEKRLIGGSDAAAIAGVHPNKTAISVWRRIVEGVEEPSTPAMRRGNLMEPVIRAMAAEDYGLKLLGPRKLRDPKRSYVRISLDDVNQAEDGEEVTEFKSVSPWAADDYGMGEDECPQHHICQVQRYTHKAKMKRARLFALIGVDDLRHYVIHADIEIQEMLEDAVDRFYVDYVKPQRPPPPDHSEGYAEYLAAKFPSDNGTLRKSSPWWLGKVAALKEVKRNLSFYEQEEKKLRAEMLAELGEDSGVDGLLSFKWTRGRSVTDWDAIAAELKISPALIEKYSRRSPFRVLRMSKNGGSTDE